MKVCIPTKDNKGMDGTVEQHFGKAPTYTILDTETREVSVIPNTSEHMGGVDLPPEFLRKNGVEIMLCGGWDTKLLRCLSLVGSVFLWVLEARFRIQ